MAFDDTDPTPDARDVALGKAIRFTRRERNLSQQDLAEKIGVSFQQVQKYERGTNRTSYSKLRDIATALQTTVPVLHDRALKFQELPAETGSGAGAQPFDAEDLELAVAIGQLADRDKRIVRGLLANMLESTT